MQKSDTVKAEEPTLLPTNKSREALKNLDGWQSTDDHKKIYREFILHNFMSAVGMIDGIAGIAEDEKHHPDVHLTQYRNLRVALTTHDVGGLSEKDFTVAARINEMVLNSNNNEHHPTPDVRHATKAPLEKKSRVKKAKVTHLAVKDTKTKKTHAKKKI